MGRLALHVTTSGVGAEITQAQPGDAPVGIEFRINGVEADLASCARSRYRIERTDGSWQIARIT